MTEAEILERYSTPGLRKTELTRSTKKINMEFDGQFVGFSRKERDELLDKYFGETTEKKT